MIQYARRFLDFAIPLLLIVAGLNWLGWALGEYWLVQLAPGLDAMHPLTALSFALAGLSLFLLRPQPPGASRRAWSGVLAAGLIVLMLLHAVERLHGRDFGLHDLLFSEAIHAAPMTVEVSVSTILGLLAAAIALAVFALDRGRLLGPAQAAAFACVAISVFGVFLYTIGRFPNDSGGPDQGLSVLTAILMLALGLALLALRANEGPMRYCSSDDLAGRLTRKMLLTAVVGTLLLVTLRVIGEVYFRLYSTATGTLLLATSLLCLFLFVIWSGGRWLRGAELAKRVAEERMSGAVAEKAQADADLMRFFELSLDMLCISGKDGYFKRVSPAFTAVLGWSVEELTTMPYMDFVHPDDIDATAREVERQLRRGEQVLAFENRYRCKDGGYRVLSWKSVPQDGHTMYAVARDVTEQNAVSAALERERGMLRTFVETAADGIVTIDERGEVLSVNSAALQMFGYSRSEVLGRNVRMLMPSPMREEHDGYLATYLRTGVKRIIGSKRELVALRKNGTEFPAELTVGEVVTDEARVFTGIVRDMSERKEYEKALVEAMYEAKRANEAKSDFLSRMSHELRTPLNSVLGFAQLIEMECRDQRQIEWVQPIIKGGEHLLQLIDEVLDISRIEAGRLTVSLEPVSAGELLRQAQTLVEPIANEEEVTITVHETCANVHVHADRQRLLQVFINLLSNAIKFNRKGGRVDIRCFGVEDDRCRIEVTDTGPGVRDEFLPQLFQPFERDSNVPKPGTGLGLALSRQLVQLMGGDIVLSSTSPEGSTFVVSLRPDAHPLSRPSEQANNPLATHFSLDGRASLLVIEDNVANLKLLEHVFAPWKELELTSAMQGRIGLDLARRHVPNAIMLDLHLPDIGGDEVLKRLQADPVTREIPVIVLSADATPSQRERLLGLGAQRYLTKPLNIALLKETLVEILGNRVERVKA